MMKEKGKGFLGRKRLLVAIIASLMVVLCLGVISNDDANAAVDPEITAPVAKDLTYTGGAQDLITEGSSAVEGTFTYSNEEDGVYGASVPQGTNAGDYVAWYIFTPNDTSTYNIRKAQVEDVKIMPKALTLTTPVTVT